ncbi:unnamed protein product [Nippostrongylus brasiliensis]|uniref:Transmembrane protein 126A n=1 Tax=Nippostrongylus brasiliensis TaxID=27835 RepID=A0A0N4YUF0_NIPBR|nr:unnamed protein product [Nippostrongylus brasiliensis]
MSLPSSSHSPSPAVVELWKRSSPPSKVEEALPLTRTPVAERLSGERSWLWTSLSQMSPSDQAIMLTNITGDWPYSKERRALNWPLHAGIVANCLSSTLIATKISSDMVLFNPKMSLLDSIRQCPKSPFVFGVYTSGIGYYMLRQILVVPEVLTERKPCSSCVLTRNVAIALGTGIALPMVSTPYLCYYITLNRESTKYPPVSNYLDFLALSWEGGRAARSLLLKLIPFQAAVAAISTYCFLWGRDRVFDTLDADPDFAREVLVKAQMKVSLKQRLLDFLHGVPLFNDIVGKPTPESDRVRIN